MRPFDQPETCRLYKDYTLKWLPQNLTLEGYTVYDFQEDPESKIDMFDQLTKYLEELKPYSQHLSEAANLRQKHFENYIRGKYIEDKDHSYWRIGLNKIAEDARNKLDTWSNIREKLFQKIISISEAKIIQQNNRILDIDKNIKNVDYCPKIRSETVVNRPKMSNSEKRKNKNSRKRERKESRKLKKEKEDKMFKESIRESNRMKILVENEFRENGGLLASDYIDDLINMDSPSKSFERAFSYENRVKNQPILIDFENKENIHTIAQIFLVLKDERLDFIEVQMSYFLFYPEFRRAFIEEAYTELEYKGNQRYYFFQLSGYCDTDEINEHIKYFRNKKINTFLCLLDESRKTGEIYTKICNLEHLLNKDNFEEKYEINMQFRLDCMTEKEQLIIIDKDIADTFFKMRKEVCEKFGLDEQKYINIDKDTKKRVCTDPNCKKCHPICHCKVCHSRIKQ